MADKIASGGGIDSYWHDQGDGKVVVQHTQDVAPILGHNKANADSRNTQAHMRHAASIPMIVWDQWMKEFKRMFKADYAKAPRKDREKFIKAKLNDKSNEFLRTWKGKL